MSEKVISKFDGEYEFLSNFYPCAVYYDGLQFESVEAAFQSAKTRSLEMRKKFVSLSAWQAKKLGRRMILRPDWEKIKDQVMLECLEYKFMEAGLVNKLIATKGWKLVEGNDWGDRYWGVYKGVGKNRLGELLTQVRRELLLMKGLGS